MQVQDDKPYDDINITPMLDLAYVLLVIFILMCTASVQGLKVDLPEGGGATKSLAGQKIQAVTINHEGKFFLNTQQVTLQQMESQLASARAANPGVLVVLKGDTVTQYQGVMDALNVIGQVGISEVGIATKAAGGGK
jgi:biopolymer transport protein ExbD